jgi:hypothetical protein
VSEGGVGEGKDVTGNNLVLLSGRTVDQDLLSPLQVNITPFKDPPFASPV